MISEAATLGPLAGKIATSAAKAVLTIAGKRSLDQLQAGRTARELRKLLGVRDGLSFDYRVPSLDHPLLDLKGPHPDDMIAFLAMAGPTIVHCYENGWLEEVDYLTTDLTHSIILIGSPEIEPLARLIFGYRRGKNGRGFRPCGDTVSLPYFWNEDPDEVQGECSRYVKGHGRVTRPNWPLMRRTDGGITADVPAVNREGLLLHDYLLVTNIPNYLTLKGLQEGQRIVSVAGLHGLGTASIANLIRSRAALKEIGEMLPRTSSSFQVLVRAYLDHDVTRMESRVRKVQVIDVQSIREPTGGWISCYETVSLRFGDWLTDDMERNRPLPGDRR